ncbi:MAG: hypothetical protein HOH04_17720 [Rhodospirillaceae bacterium]|nr:hypothetical protein [Rhodospirillaceae bacterium]
MSLPNRPAQQPVEREASQPDSRRAVRDTVEIGDSGNKRVNLARASELAAALPDAGTDRKAFDAALAAAQEDVQRITKLFGTVLSELQAGPGQTQANVEDDTTTLSEGGEEVINFDRTKSLISRIEAGGLDGGEFVRAIEQASKDTRRMAELFSETLKAAFPHDYRV